MFKEVIIASLGLLTGWVTTRPNRKKAETDLLVSWQMIATKAVENLNSATAKIDEQNRHAEEREKLIIDLKDTINKQNITIRKMSIELNEFKTLLKNMKNEQRN